MKRYVSMCEKKIANQQELCESPQKQVDQLNEVVKKTASQQELCQPLQKQVEHLNEVVKVLVTYPYYPSVFRFSGNHGKNSGLFHISYYWNTLYFISQALNTSIEMSIKKETKL